MATVRREEDELMLSERARLALPLLVATANGRRVNNDDGAVITREEVVAAVRGADGAGG